MTRFILKPRSLPLAVLIKTALSSFFVEITEALHYAVRQIRSSNSSAARSPFMTMMNGTVDYAGFDGSRGRVDARQRDRLEDARRGPPLHRRPRSPRASGGERLDQARRRAGRPRGDAGLEQLPPPGSLLRVALHGRWCCTRSTCASLPPISDTSSIITEDTVICVDEDLLPILEKLEAGFRPSNTSSS